jgi:hypothetical protein
MQYKLYVFCSTMYHERILPTNRKNIVCEYCLWEGEILLLCECCLWVGKKYYYVNIIYG